MPRKKSSAPQMSGRGRNRHGRGVRGSITGPHLPMLTNRIDSFDSTVASTADYLKGLWRNELSTVRFEVAAAPIGNSGLDGIDRWCVDRSAGRIILYRVPIQRLSRLHRNDELHRRMYVESCVFRAVAEYLGKEPWDLDEHHHLP